MRRPFDPNVDRTTRHAAKSGKPHHDLTEKRGDRMLPVILDVTNTSPAWTIRPESRMGSGLSGHDFLLENRQKLFRFRQSQTQRGDVPEVIGAIDLHDVCGLTLALGAGFHQPQNPARTSTPGQTTDARNTLQAARPPCVDGPSDAREKVRILTGRSIAIMCSAFRRGSMSAGPCVDGPERSRVKQQNW